MPVKISAQYFFCTFLLYFLALAVRSFQSMTDTFRVQFGRAKLNATASESVPDFLITDHLFNKLTT